MIPKLRLFKELLNVPDVGCTATGYFDCCTINDLKKVIDFYNKYKDKILMFKQEYPNIYKDYYDNWVWKANSSFNDWLFDKCFKME